MLIMQIKPRYIAQFVSLTLTGAAFAQSPQPVELMPIIVSSQTADSTYVTHTQSTVTQEQLKRTGAQNIEDIVKYDPSVDVDTDNMRMGHNGYNIRGIRHQRIQMNIDGIPLAEPFEDAGPRVGRNISAKLGVDVVEPETLRQVDIDKSGNSALYGNGALGGSINMMTYNPSDFVHTDKPFHAGLKYGYRSTYNAHTKTATLAGHSQFVEGLLMLTHRDSKELENFAENDVNGDNKTVANDQVIRGKNVLAKLNFSHNVHHIEFTFEHYDRRVNTQREELLKTTSRPLRQQAPNSPPIIRTDKISTATSLDKFTRERMGFIYRYLPENHWLDEINFQGYSQRLKIHDTTYQYSESFASNGNKLNETTKNNNRLAHTIYGVKSELKTDFETGTVSHRLSNSIEFRRDELDRVRAEDYQIQSRNPSIQNTQFRLFPKTVTKNYSLSLQDQMTFTNDVALNIALRYQYEERRFKGSHLDTTPNQDKAAVNKKLTYSTLSPSVRLHIPLSENLALLAGYAYAKKLPNPQYIGVGAEMNMGPQGKYKINPNPNLKPEEANSFDLGLLYSTDTFKARLNTYYNQYKNFLSPEQVLPPCQGCLREVYYSNKGRVKTYGAELFTAWQFTNNWSFTNTVAWMKGYALTPKKPLTTAHPLNGVIGVEYAQDTWGVGTKFRWSDKKRKAGTYIDKGVEYSYFKAPGYGVWDLTAYYQPVKQIEIRAGVFNLFDKKYWTFGDVVETPNNSMIDRYTQPGRNYAVNVELKF
ncbi:heme/hemoglobin uptake outer membrane receptor PhuR [Pasteurella canis]|uniref:Heme/hemoglobin uptake outer membrane receptor PhuR n=2 Tax=Pasteurella canis TaxID=753 RepID=A0ABQ4VIX8_9PAST|nr:heme/hemoglobin uptake outer membrane receptor PhuR [Pasteurella canis]